MKVGQAIFALDLVHSELDLSKGMVLILLQIGQRYLDNTTLERIVGVFETGRSVYQRLPDAITHTSDRHQGRKWGFPVLADIEGGGCLQTESPGQ